MYVFVHYTYVFLEEYMCVVLSEAIDAAQVRPVRINVWYIY